MAPISISLVLAVKPRALAQQVRPADSSVPPTPGTFEAQNTSSKARFYTNRSLLRTYRSAYIPGLSTSAWSGVGEITYDGRGRFCGRDEYLTFDGSYSVNPDGNGTSTMIIRIRDSQQIFPRVMRAIRSFRIHPGGGIEFETSSRMRFGKTVGTQHHLVPSSSASCVFQASGIDLGRRGV